MIFRDFVNIIFLSMYHNYITAGNVRIITIRLLGTYESSKLRGFLTKSPNCRKPRSINFRKAYLEINQGLEEIATN